jgi:hypothetical protein
MRKAFGLIAVLISSAVLLVSPALARDRDDYRNNGNGYRSGGYTYSYPNNYNYSYNDGYAAPYNGYGYSSDYSAPYYNGRQDHDWLEHRRHEEHERSEHQRNSNGDWRR